MEETLEVLAGFQRLGEEELKKLCPTQRLFLESVKMVAAADITNFKATREGGILTLTALCHASQEQRTWLKAAVDLRQVVSDANIAHLEVVHSRCTCKLGYPTLNSSLVRII